MEVLHPFCLQRYMVFVKWKNFSGNDMLDSRKNTEDSCDFNLIVLPLQ